MATHAGSSEPRDGRSRSARPHKPGSGAIEWRTLALFIAVHSAWLAAIALYGRSAPLAIVVLALTVALHSSLQHEAIHRHPTWRAGWNEALASLPVGLLIPFRRYRDLHLRHHADGRLTDPYDDPESFYLAVYDYDRLPLALRIVLGWNNVLLVRLAIGPALSAAGFLMTEMRGLVRPRAGKGQAARVAWALHPIGVIAVLAIVRLGFGMPIGAYLIAVYLGQSLLALRSFCEHQWADTPDARTVIVERSWLAPLFLHNNLHLVHHKQPSLPWYELPGAYRARRDEWRALNGGYVFTSYGAVLRRFAVRSKEPVAHPARRDGRADTGARAMRADAQIAVTPASPAGGSRIAATIAARSAAIGRSSA